MAADDPIAGICRIDDDRAMSSDNLKWLASWYLAQCDGDWEHTYGVAIDTLDNPGWTIKIDLWQTELEGLEFTKVSVGEPADDLNEWRSLGSWWVAEVKGNAFEATCGPLDLDRAIGIFREWAESAGRVR